MTANDIVRQLKAITYRFNTGEIPVRTPDGEEVNLKFEDKKDPNGDYYIEMMEDGIV